MNIDDKIMKKIEESMDQLDFKLIHKIFIDNNFTWQFKKEPPSISEIFFNVLKGCRDCYDRMVKLEGDYMRTSSGRFLYECFLDEGEVYFRIFFVPVGTVD